MILLPTTDLCGQATAHTFSGDYDQVSLDSFVETLEESSGLVFFYRPEWTSGVTITAKGEGLSLTEVLLENLEPHGLTCYMDGGNNVFILSNSIFRLEDLIAADRGSEISEPEVPNETMESK